MHYPRRSHHSLRRDTASLHVTSAVGMEETAGRLRARRSSLFTRTLIWITGLICLAFLCGSLTQAWSNNQLTQRVQTEQEHLRQLRNHHEYLQQLANHYKDNSVVENEARQQLGYVRANEQVLIIVSPANQARQNISSPHRGHIDQNFWLEWIHVFGGS